MEARQVVNVIRVRSSSSATPEGELSLEAITEMDDDEFAAAWAKLEKQNEK